MGLSLPGPVEFAAGPPPRHAGLGHSRGPLRQLSGESRPGCQLGPRDCGSTRSTSPGRYRALTALLLLSPGTPLLFQGQEFAASTPFLFFADHDPELARLVREGRWQFLRRFASLAGPEHEVPPADLCGPEAFARSKLDLDQRRRHAEAYALASRLVALAARGRGFFRPARRSSAGRGDRPRGAAPATSSARPATIAY